MQLTFECWSVNLFDNSSIKGRIFYCSVVVQDPEAMLRVGHGLRGPAGHHPEGDQRLVCGRDHGRARQSGSRDGGHHDHQAPRSGQLTQFHSVGLYKQVSFEKGALLLKLGLRQ